MKGLGRDRTITGADAGVSTYLNSARDRAPDVLVFKHGVVATVKIAEVPICSIDQSYPFLTQDREIDRR